MGTCSGAWQCHQASGRRRCSAGIDSRCRSVGGAAATILTRPQGGSETSSRAWDAESWFFSLFYAEFDQEHDRRLCFDQ